MDYFLTIGAIIVFIENRLQSGFTYNELEKSTGYSLVYLRELFMKYTGKSLSKYILSRRIANSAFEIINGNESILTIASKYGFANPDTFTRAFSRITGFTPQEFRKQRVPVGRVKLYGGVYGVSERNDNMNKEKINNTEGSTVLYGVPKVGYGVYGCTPYPICLKAVANYLGEDIDYDFAMVASGAAFRLIWDTTCWNGGNVDILLAFDNPINAFKNGIEALGRSFKLLGRKNSLTQSDTAKFSSLETETTKSDFISFIKEHIDNGNPCIALGIIGPPEACIVTGYRNEGKTLLGWNFFQDNPECSVGVTFDESGYFVTDNWWDNTETIAVMSMGDKINTPFGIKQIISNGIEVLTGRKHGDYAKGIFAYDAWKKAISDESQFPKDAILPILIERLMCQGDAMDCLADGRDNARRYFEKLSSDYPEQPLFSKIAASFRTVAVNAFEMYKTLGGWERGEKQIKELAKPETRQKICHLIDVCKAADQNALELLKLLYSQL